MVSPPPGFLCAVRVWRACDCGVCAGGRSVLSDSVSEQSSQPGSSVSSAASLVQRSFATPTAAPFPQSYSTPANRSRTFNGHGPRWVADEDAKRCSACFEEFWLLKRKQYVPLVMNSGRERC